MTPMLPALLRFNSVYQRATFNALRRSPALNVGGGQRLTNLASKIAETIDFAKPALNIEKARLSHDSLAPSAHGPLPSASQIRSDLARRIFRGALKSDCNLPLRGKSRMLFC